MCHIITNYFKIGWGLKFKTNLKKGTKHVIFKIGGLKLKKDKIEGPKLHLSPILV